jgi:predicted nucleic-acid-binding protein
VLRRLYGATQSEIRATVCDPLDTPQFRIENRMAVVRALENIGENPGNLSDALIAQLALDARCQKIVTFDKNAVKLGMTMLG